VTIASLDAALGDAEAMLWALFRPNAIGVDNRDVVPRRSAGLTTKVELTVETDDNGLIAGAWAGTFNDRATTQIGTEVLQFGKTHFDHAVAEFLHERGGERQLLAQPGKPLHDLGQGRTWEMHAQMEPSPGGVIQQFLVIGRGHHDRRWWGQFNVNQ